ncbi:DUF2652 domain-containing protein [Chryseolinea sp. H1M3-3]|uniref:DUF2652 domain-containing protein n=1 Tax=Chryseolinea sp. H1M3-3 TaxID=3034144 RepID=UPI0023EDB667|nr:DUF2652 domain-containing protein [Chryseolinea sp. H1M3-3]
MFYKFGDPPTLKEVYKQVEKMFVEFHRNIIAYDNKRYCQCEACISTINLTLKIITHYGEFTEYKVKNFHKLLGKDIIVAHQLLKNDIPRHEYWLITQNLLNDQKQLDFAQWMKWQSSSKQTETGDISFHYAQLGQLRNKIQPEIPSFIDLSKMSKVFSIHREYPTDIITLFHATGDFRYRHRWQDGILSIQALNHYLPRVGMKCRCVTDRGIYIIHASDYHYSEHKIQFTESDEKQVFCTRYTLERADVKKTILTLDYYVKGSPLAQLFFRLTRKRSLENTFRKSSQNLDNLVKDLKIPSALHT